MQHIQPYLDYFAAHPSWAIAVIFLIAFGEALLVIGLVVPSTAVLVGAGALVGTGQLEFWPVLMATMIGAIAGDQVSYWAGRIFGERLKLLWPLSRYPHLVAKGEEFIKTHGGKSIALGRFVPGIKAVVPGIAGMFGMGQMFFLSINVVSGIVWALVHLLPGILLGQALALAGDLSGRLLVILLVLLTVLAIAGWLVRILAGSVTPYRKALQGRIAAWARQQGNRPMRRFARGIAPENPRSVLLVMLAVLGVGALAILIDLVSGRVLRSAAGNFDSSLYNLFSELRSAPGDELFIRLTMLGDDFVIYATAAAMIMWLLARRAWRGALATGVTVAAGKLIFWGSHFFIARQPPSNITGPFNADAFYFPSGHSLMIGLLVGLLSVLCNRGMARWTRALIVACGALVVIAIAFSRLYLGVNWLGDVLAGLLVAAVLSTIYGVVTQTLPAQRIRPFSLVAVTTLVFVIAGALHISSDYNRAEALYAARDKMLAVALVDWPQTGWNKVASRRIDLAGVPEEQFVGQWLGSLPALQTAVQAANFTVIPKWTWKDSFTYLDPQAPLAVQRPRPALHEGLKAKLTAVQIPSNGGDYRLTVRAFKANALAVGQASTPVYLLSLTHEVPIPHLKLFAVPSDLPPTREEEAAFIAQFRAAPNVDVVAEKMVDGQPLVIFKPKL